MNTRIIFKVLWLRRQLRRRDRWTRRQLEEHQTRSLRLLREHAYARSPFFYRRFHADLIDRPLFAVLWGLALVLFWLERRNTHV
jgi:phenylacetate-CoA ligase